MAQWRLILSFDEGGKEWSNYWLLNLGVILYIGIRGNSDFTMIELITTSVFILSSLYGGPVIAAEASNITSTSSVYVMSTNTAEETRLIKQKEIETIARKYFKDDPILVEIARCESSFRQVDANGNLLRGKVNKGDVGLMQINEYYHADKAESMGFDLETLNGNMGYAKYLYDKEGVKPWVSSKPCWKTALKTAPANQVALK